MANNSFLYSFKICILFCQYCANSWQKKSSYYEVNCKSAMDKSSLRTSLENFNPKIYKGPSINYVAKNLTFLTVSQSRSQKSYFWLWSIKTTSYFVKQSLPLTLKKRWKQVNFLDFYWVSKKFLYYNQYWRLQMVIENAFKVLYNRQPFS